MSETVSTSIEGIIAEMLVPRGLGYGSDPLEPTDAERQEARRIARIVRAVLASDPRLLLDFGWQVVSLVSADDKLSRGFALYAPPARGY